MTFAVMLDLRNGARRDSGSDAWDHVTEFDLRLH